MSKTVLVHNRIEADNRWISEKEFLLKGVLCDKDGATSITKDRIYRILDKKSRSILPLERALRTTLGIIIILGTFFISVSIPKKTKKLFTKRKITKIFITKNKKINQSNPYFNPYKESIGTGIVLTDELKEKLKNKKNEKLFEYSNKPSQSIFYFTEADKFVFKITESLKDQLSSIEQRYQLMLYAKMYIDNNNLDLLLIPDASFTKFNIDGDDHDIIIEKRINIYSDCQEQKDIFEKESGTLTEAIKQLAIFISHTGFSDVELRNIPIIKDSFDTNGNRRIALIDLEEMNSSTIGLFGNFTSKHPTSGLLQCVSLLHAPIISEIAKEYHVNTDNFDNALKKKQESDDFQKEIKNFYTERGFKTGSEKIELKDPLFEEITEQDTKEKLHNIATDLICRINKGIEERVDKRLLLDERRRIQILLDSYKDERDILYLENILSKLKIKRYIYNFNKTEPYYMTIQA